MASQDTEFDFDLFDEVIIDKELSSNQQANQELQEKYEKAMKQLSLLEKENRILKANISSLFKTAVSEIERKDGQISQLRSELDDFILRRNKKWTGDQSKETTQEDKHRRPQSQDQNSRREHNRDKSTSSCTESSSRSRHSSVNDRHQVRHANRDHSHNRRRY